MILLLANTRSNRLFVRSLGTGFRMAYPVERRVMLGRLRAGEDPKGSGILLL